jgi:uncharacterized protein YndB with AHSA1/START domain
MNMNQTAVTDAIVEEITIHAPAERIFDALTSPQALMKWWGKEGQFGVTECELDLRQGGKWVMRGDSYGGRRFQVTGEYVTVERPRLLEFTWTPDWSEGAAGSVVRWDLNERDGETTVRLTHSGLTETARQNHRGWTQIVAWLRDYAEKA